jgi:hypothetical protein
VRGRDAAVDQSGLRGEERSGANADDATGVLGRDLDPADGVRVVPCLVDTDATGQDKRVDGFARVRQRLGDEREAGQGGGRFAVARDDADGVTLIDASLAGQEDGGTGEHLERADQVECLDARVAEYHYRSHESSVRDHRDGV